MTLLNGMIQISMFTFQDAGAGLIAASMIAIVPGNLHVILSISCPSANVFCLLKAVDVLKGNHLN